MINLKLTDSSDLFHEVFALIASKNEVLAHAFLAGVQKESSVGYSTEHFEDMRLINRFWRLQLGNLRTDTIDARECLVNCKDKQIWLDNFNAYVLPVILERHLPRPLF